jgi:hypothetical protein
MQQSIPSQHISINIFEYESATCNSMGEREQENKPKPFF